MNEAKSGLIVLAILIPVLVFLALVSANPKWTCTTDFLPKNPAWCEMKALEMKRIDQAVKRMGG